MKSQDCGRKLSQSGRRKRHKSVADPMPNDLYHQDQLRKTTELRPQKIRRLAKFAPVLVAALGLIATLFVARQNILGGNLKDRLDFEKQAMAHTGLIEGKLQANLQKLRTLAGLWASRTGQKDSILSEQEFFSFIKHGLNLQQDALAIYVIGSVPIGQEQDYLDLLRIANGKEWEDFQILSPRGLADSRLIAERPEDRLLPLTYVWDLNDSVMKTGLDTSELQYLARFVRKADELKNADEALVSIFFPDDALSSNNQEPKFLTRFSAIVCIPESTESAQLVAKYVRMDFSTEGLIEESIGAVEAKDMALTIINEDDRTDRSFMPFLSSQRPQFEFIDQNVTQIDTPQGLSFTHRIEFPNSQWTLIFTPKPGYYERPLLATLPIVAIGLIITLLMVSTTNLLLRRRDEILELVKRRTSELTAANTELQKKHAELAAVNEDLKQRTEEAQKASAAKSEFLATMSHEIRTPMNGVLGMASLLGQSELNAEQKSKLSIIKSSGKALLDLLNDILDLSKIESGRLELETEPFNLVALLEEIDQAWVSIFATKGVALVFQRDAWLTDHIVGDVTRLRQILNNLISNALKFTDAGEVRVILSQSGNLSAQIVTHISVQDTGIGINTQALPHIFDQFTQADASTTRRYGGTGLGLAICKNLLGHMGGSIGVTSNQGEGTTIWFEFPSRAAAEQNVASRQTVGDWIPPKQTQPIANLRILVAEDNPVNQQLMKALLSTLPCEFDMVQNGEEALQAILSENYDVVLMDIQMPVMDGLEATRRIRQLQSENAGIPIIAMTANALAGDKEKYLAAGMTDYVSKPLDPNLLIDKTLKLGAQFRDRQDDLNTPYENAAG